jgi:predicted nucleic acid-binding protein
MPTSRICVDASVVVRLVVFPNHATIQAIWQQWMRERQEIIAPALMLYEVINALHQYYRQKMLTEAAVTIAANTLLALPIQIYSDAELHRASLLIARRYGLSAAYDAHYVALAEHAGADLWTTDQRLVSRCQQDWVKLVE